MKKIIYGSGGHDTSKPNNNIISDEDDGIPQDPESAATIAISDVISLQTKLNDKLMFHLDGSLKPTAKMNVLTAMTLGGSVVFNLTVDNELHGPALFKNVYLDAIQIEAYSTTDLLIFGQPTLAPNKKTITFPVNQVEPGSLSIIGASDDISVRLMIVGD